MNAEIDDTGAEAGPEPTDEVCVIEDDEAEQARKQELEERISEQWVDGEPPALDDESSSLAGPPSARKRPGSPATVVAEARGHRGYRESGENDTKFNRWLGRLPGYGHGGYGYPWCHSFVSYCLWHSNSAGAGPRTAGCLAGVSWFKSTGCFHQSPKAGDLVYYGGGGGTHVELVIAVTAGTIRTIGGNTSGSLNGNFFNGDGVYEKTVSRSSSRIFGYGRPRYGSGAAPAGGGSQDTSAGPITSVRSVKRQQQAVNRLGYKPKLVVDNEWGPKTKAGVKWLQKKVGTEADGQWGKNTEAKYIAHVK